MSMRADQETLARALAAQVLRAEDWVERLEGICLAMRVAAERVPAHSPHTPETMRAVAARAEAILRQIANADPLTIGRLYFDLLPRDPDHPLTKSVVAAFSDGRAVIRMLRDSGTRLDIQKDDTGENFVTIHDIKQAKGLGNGLKNAIIRAMALTAEMGCPPQGDLHRLH